MTSTSPTSNPTAQPIRPYKPRHTIFPYTTPDFLRQDESVDTDFYSQSRFVTHIDDTAIALLRSYYLHNLPPSGRILDLCSSWISHFPPSLEAVAIKAKEQETSSETEQLEVIGLGINAKELAANPILKYTLLQDLNENPTIPPHLAPLSAATCVVSVDYLTQPLKVLSSLRSLMKPDTHVHLVISNRCFPTKAVGRWLRVGEEERLLMVGDYLWWAGFRDVEIVTLNDGKGQAEAGSWFAFLKSTDPLWVVRGRNPGLEESNGERK
ncbi:hypothetical protein MMC12_006530 [Toensbergia leucococca]|nr:hypothetical protein [Toensbergia leucococca]